MAVGMSHLAQQARLRMAVIGHGRYPSALRDYTDLIVHPKAQTDKYRQEVTPGSVLIPLLLAWVAALNDPESIACLAELKALPITNGGQDLLKVLTDASKSADGFQSLSAVKAGYFPLILTACRHYRLPVPHPFGFHSWCHLNPND